MLLYFYPPSGWENKKLTLSILNGDMFSIVGATGITIENLVIEAGLKNGIVLDDSCSNKTNSKVKNTIPSDNLIEQLVPDTDIINRCIGCNIDLGIDNPRQYCCKTHCPDELDK